MTGSEADLQQGCIHLAQHAFCVPRILLGLLIYLENATYTPGVLLVSTKVELRTWAWLRVREAPIADGAGKLGKRATEPQDLDNTAVS